jgi:hypothetical protein
MLFVCLVGADYLSQIFCSGVSGRKNITFIPPNENNLARISDATAIYSAIETHAVHLYLTRNRNLNALNVPGLAKGGCFRKNAIINWFFQAISVSLPLLF